MSENRQNGLIGNETAQTSASQRQTVDREPIDLVELCYVMLRHSVAICACAMLCAVAMLGYTYFFVPATYQATAKLYVVSASKDSVINLSDLQMGSQLTADYKELILGRTILNETLNSLGLDWTPAKLSSAITITNPSNTRILRISAVANTPKMAADIANEIARQTMECLPRIMACDTPNIAQIAEIPNNKRGPNYTQNTIKGALAGALLAMGFFFLRFLMNDTIVTSDDVTHYLQLETLAVIPENTDAGRKKLSRRGKNGRSKQSQQKRNEKSSVQ